LLDELEAIAPGVFSEKAADARDAVILLHADSPGEQLLAQFVEVRDDESWVSFFCGAEVPFYAKVKLLRSALKPATTASAKRLRFFNFLKAENGAEKFAGRLLATLRSRHLEVIEMTYAHFH
jgi:hypothetical protein